jgi:biotin-(acetyl-CoA carboxylase) ligase
MRTSVKRIVQEKINTWRQDITLAFIRVLRKYGIMSCMRWSYQIVCGPVKMCGMLDEWVQSENGYYVGFRNICQMKV